MTQTVAYVRHLTHLEAGATSLHLTNRLIRRKFAPRNMKRTKKPGPIDGYIIEIEIPSKWYKSKKIWNGVSCEFHSIWGTSDDHEYGKKELEEKFSQVEEYTPPSATMPNLGLLNWIDDEWTKYKEKEVVEEEAVWDPDEWDKLTGSQQYTFGGLRTGDITPPMFSHTLSEIKYKCTRSPQT